MSFEVLALPYSWVHKDSVSSRFENLKHLINASYNKPRYRFGIIQSPRIKNNDTVLSDLAIDANDEICIYLLLGKKEKFDDLANEGYKRDLTKVATTFNQVFANDIPERYYSIFNLEDINTAKITFADSDFEFSDEILNRCIASVGLRSFHGKAKPATKDFELTAFTSFMRNTAPVFLDFIINQCLLDSERFEKISFQGSLNDFQTIIIHADVIKEHGLVEYYTKKCSFTKSSQEDILIKVDNGQKVDNGVLEKGILASKNFHLSFLERIIHIEPK
ncbi:Biofilm-induced protein [Candida albicans P76067]